VSHIDFEGAIMTGNKVSAMKRVALAAALAAGVSSVANAGMGRFEDIYRYFDNPVIDRSPSAWRQVNPQGMTDRELQAVSSEAPAWQVNKPVLTSVPAEPSLKQTHPNGLTVRELQALSSDAPAFQSPNASDVMASNKANLAQSSNKETLVTRLANFFRPK
jgi:hypothetical protein